MKREQLERRRARIARVNAKRPVVTAVVEEIMIDDPVRRRRIGDALLRILNSSSTPEEGR